MPLSEQQGISVGRRGAAALAMMGSGGMLAWEALRHFGPDWIVVAFAGILAAGGVAITRRSLVLQTLARGAAWVILVPAALAVVIELTNGKVPGLSESVIALTTTAALLLGRPMLHTKEARAEFDPHQYRRTLLAGSTATAATAFLTGGIGLEMMWFDDRYIAVGFIALTLSLLASALAVVKMRAWGILLGAATSATLLGAAAVTGGHAGHMLALLAAPMLALHTLPILLARLRGTPKTRVAPLTVSEMSDVAEAPRYRVAVDSAPASFDFAEDAIDAEREHFPQEGCKIHV